MLCISGAPYSSQGLFSWSRDREASPRGRKWITVLEVQWPALSLRCVWESVWPTADIVATPLSAHRWVGPQLQSLPLALPGLFVSKRLNFSKRITTGSGGMLADSDLYRPSCLAQVNETLEKLFYTEKPRWIPRGTNEKRHACKYLQVNSWTLWRMESLPHKGSEAGAESHLLSFNFFLLREKS